MPGHRLSADFVERYARPPAQMTIDRAVATHSSVRALLGDAEYATLLQGSYRNDTALWDMNDVDLVAVARNTVSGTFSTESFAAKARWEDLFSHIEDKLRGDPRYSGKFLRKDKCIRLSTEIKIDIVPAVRIRSADEDPIAIHSFSAGAERQNWPRTHYEAATGKSGRTNGNFKKTVRVLKRWARCWFGTRRVAPSYYLECLVYAQPDHYFTGDLAETFVIVAAATCNMRYESSRLLRLAGDGDLLAPAEWTQAQFTEFQATLRTSLGYARAALAASTEAAARELWARSFNGLQAA